MNQEQFASALGTTTVSINRWENGKALPNQMAQTNIFQFCKAQGIDVAALIVEMLHYEHTEGRNIFYHGSKKGIVGDIAPVSHEECDFGRGFYMGTGTLQPLTLVCAEDKPKFYAVEFDLSDLKVLEVEIGMDWAMMIAYYRKQMEHVTHTPIYEKYAHFADGYDVIVGYIANDRMYTELARFFNGTITDTALLKCLAVLDLGKQYVAITQKACDQIRILEERDLHLLERLALQDKSVQRRNEGIAMADEVVKKYRREGQFFDEILGGI
ncbi:DUF3990 domain-containing protein [Lawsonibacter sp. DFI.5.51]|nr:DUF3990 domain-containing protein [Lawsonibacter sp. DFI.5.51]